jgi:hypothetical protein
MKSFGILVSLVLICCTLPVYAGQPRLESRHRQLTARGEEGESFQLLENESPLVFSAAGPGEVAFRFCLILAAESALPLVDITVVRDENVQGTVRARMENAPGLEFSSGARCSATQFLVLSVPAGRHRYQLFFTGAAAVAISPARALRAGEKTLEATPAQDRSAQPAVPAKKTAKKTALAYPRENPGEDLLDAPVVPPRQFRVQSEIIRPLGASRAALDTSIALSIMLTSASLACLISAGTLQHRAEQEEIQIEAGRLHQQARRAWKAAAVTGTLAALSSLSAFSFYLQLSAGGVETRLQIRF